MKIRTLLSKYTGHVVLYSLYPGHDWTYFSGPMWHRSGRSDKFTLWVELVLTVKETYERGR